MNVEIKIDVGIPEPVDCGAVCTLKEWEAMSREERIKMLLDHIHDHVGAYAVTENGKPLEV